MHHLNNRRGRTRAHLHKTACEGSKKVLGVERSRAR